MESPIEAYLDGRKLAMARMQDRIIELIYEQVQPDAVLYGGTAVWRCFGGGRFSEDIDIYVGKGFESRLRNSLRSGELGVVSQEPGFPLNMRISDGSAEILLKAKAAGTPAAVISQYMRVDGSSMTISTLSAAELMVRKIEAYEGRQYIRDIYDIVQLTNHVAKDDYYVNSKLGPFLKSINGPIDSAILKSLVYKGKAMSFHEMKEYLIRWSGEV